MLFQCEETLKQIFEPFKCTHYEKNNNIKELEKFSACNGLLVENDLLKCAVLIILFRTNNEYHVILTVRSLKLKSFPGEICFPGGKFDKNLDKTYADTAVREANEEICLKPENFRVICQLCPFVSPVGHWILPVVGVLFDPNAVDGSDPTQETLHIAQSLKANEEVELIFWIPISFFLDKNRISFIEAPFMVENSLKKGNFFDKMKINTFNRMILQFDDWPFENEMKPTNPILYGINATILMTIVLAISQRFDVLEVPKFEINSSQDLKEYLNVFRFMAYLLYKNNKLSREKRIKKLKAKL